MATIATLRCALRAQADPADGLFLQGFFKTAKGGWMLREAGLKNCAALERFLGQHGASMPRTMLRYAIERLPSGVRKRYMALDRATSIT